MGLVRVQRSCLVDTANAIRQKLGSTEDIKPSQFAENIAVIAGVSGIETPELSGNTLIIPTGYILAKIEQKQLNLPTKIVLIK